VQQVVVGATGLGLAPLRVAKLGVVHCVPRVGVVGLTQSLAGLGY
jgi:hypothetical protein